MMNRLIYILAYPFLWFIALLPFKLLYFLSDCLFVVIYYIIGYRKKVVMENLKIALPDRSEDELKVIRKEFFKHFVDIFLEMAKMFTLTEEENNKRFRYENPELLNELYKDGKSLILMNSHYGNWEWMLNLPAFIDYHGVGAYTRISNPYFDKAIKKSRGKFGVELIQTSKMVRKMIKDKQEGVQSVYGLLSDQSPQIRNNTYWSEFMGVKVPIHTGGEVLSKKFDMNMVYMKTKRIKRGYYSSTFSVISTDVKSHPDFELTDNVLEIMKQQIEEEPAYYFWTHKRFKHRDKAPK